MRVHSQFYCFCQKCTTADAKNRLHLEVQRYHIDNAIARRRADDGLSVQSLWFSVVFAWPNTS